MTPRPPTPPPPPSPPTPPAPPAAPGAPNPPVADLRERARQLAKMKRDDALSELKKLAPADLDAIEKAMIGALSTDEKLKKQGIELRRIIRFVRHPPAALPAGQPFTTSGGAAEPDVKVAGGGRVTLKKDVHVSGSGIGESKEAYSLTYTGPQAADMRWLQFIWRMVVPEFPAGATAGKPHKRKLTHGGQLYLLTTDPKKPRWTTDSAVKWSAFYEANNTVKRSADGLAMFDFPSPMREVVAELYKSAASPPTRVVSQFHASTYLINGMEVLYRADIHLTWSFTRTSAPSVDPPVFKIDRKVDLKGGPAQELEAAHRARLAVQHPDVDYLPGPAIGAPQPADEFDPVPALAPNGWDKRTILEQFADVARLAQAELIDDVDDVRTISKDRKPGLNFDQLANPNADGETGYIDAKGAYHNPDLPTERDAALPRVAMILDERAFKLGNTVREKTVALGTMRHEMMHAVHAQLAIGWLLKWRDEFTDMAFKDWLREEKRRTRIGEVDFAVVSTGISSPLDKRATEVLAWTEGFLTALPFLPATPDFGRMKTEAVWPGAISELRGAGEQYEKLSSAPGSDRDVRDAVVARIRRACSSLDQTKRNALHAWIPFLLNPKSLNPTDADESAVRLINSSFPPVKGFLKDVQKACPK